MYNAQSIHIVGNIHEYNNIKIIPSMIANFETKTTESTFSNSNLENFEFDFKV